VAAPAGARPFCCRFTAGTLIRTVAAWPADARSRQDRNGRRIRNGLQFRIVGTNRKMLQLGYMPQNPIKPQSPPDSGA
jgi:hypothetical protein